MTIHKNMIRYTIEYKCACLNCMQTDGVDNIFFWQSEKEDFNFREPKPSHEFESIYKFKRELSKQKKKCQFCSSEGKFDIWDFKINSESVFMAPLNTQPTAIIKIDKKNSVLTPDIQVVGQVTILMIEDFFNGIITQLKNYPDDIFISKNNGFLNAVLFFDPNTFSCYFNIFRFAGLSKDEIKNTIKKFKETIIPT